MHIFHSGRRRNSTQAYDFPTAKVSKCPTPLMRSIASNWNLRFLLFVVVVVVVVEQGDTKTYLTRPSRSTDTP